MRHKTVFIAKEEDAMRFKQLFEDWSLTNIKINVGFAEAEFNPSPQDEEAAWEMYVELITRVSTQRLLPEHGDESAALASIRELFQTTRDILKSRGRNCREFSKIAIIVLNQIIRPFTSKWHKIDLDNGFIVAENRELFRIELADLQINLSNYTKLLSSIAKVEDLTDIEN